MKTNTTTDNSKKDRQITVVYDGNLTAWLEIELERLLVEVLPLGLLILPTSKGVY